MTVNSLNLIEVTGPSIDHALDSVEAVFNQAFNYRGVFADRDFVNETFAQETVKRVLSEMLKETL